MTIANVSNSPDGFQAQLNAIAEKFSGKWEDLRFPATAINPSGADSYASAIKLVEFDIHYLANALGSTAIHGDDA